MSSQQPAPTFRGSVVRAVTAHAKDSELNPLVIAGFHLSFIASNLPLFLAEPVIIINWWSSEIAQNISRIHKYEWGTRLAYIAQCSHSLWVSGGDDVEVDIHVQNDCSTPYQVVQVVAAQTNQPEGEQSKDNACGQ